MDSRGGGNSAHLFANGRDAKFSEIVMMQSKEIFIKNKSKILKRRALTYDIACLI